METNICIKANVLLLKEKKKDMLLQADKVSLSATMELFPQVFLKTGKGEGEINIQPKVTGQKKSAKGFSAFLVQMLFSQGSQKEASMEFTPSVDINQPVGLLGC